MKHLEKNLKIKLWGLLDDYGFWTQYKKRYWEKDLRDRFWKDFLKLIGGENNEDNQ